MAIYFYLPSKRTIVPVVVHNCWTCFTKPQQANIVSWFKCYLAKQPELEEVRIPLYLKKAATLVGAPLGSMSNKELAQIHINSADYVRGYVYDETKYQSLCLDVSKSILEATHGNSRGLFFPECSNKNLLAYDCLVKTTNFMMGFPLFTMREQGIRLIMNEHHKSEEKAAIIKMKGGIPMECMEDFAVDDHSAYSFVKLASFDYMEMLSNSHGEKCCPAKEVLAYIHDQMLTQSLHTKLLVILKGSRITEFQHALCLLRRGFKK